MRLLCFSEAPCAWCAGSCAGSGASALWGATWLGAGDGGAAAAGFSGAAAG